MTADDIRTIIAKLEGTTEEPHHHLISFRIKGKIFATMPADASYLNIFVPEPVREAMLGMHPDDYEKVWWGKQVMGLKALTDRADRRDVADLLATAYRFKFGK
jgi:hypothetical protein